MVTAEERAAEATERRTLEGLYVRHGSAARRLAFLLTGDLALSEDIAQDAFIRAAGRLAHLRNPEGFEAYLRKTVVNIVRMHFRRRRVERVHEQSPPAEVPRDIDAEHDLREALMKLPLRQRGAVVLRYYVDLSDEETAELLRCRRSTVRSLIARAMPVLRESLEE